MAWVLLSVQVCFVLFCFIHFTSFNFYQAKNNLIVVGCILMTQIKEAHSPRLCDLLGSRFFWRPYFSVSLWDFSHHFNLFIHLFNFTFITTEQNMIWLPLLNKIQVSYEHVAAISSLFIPSLQSIQSFIQSVFFPFPPFLSTESPCSVCPLRDTTINTGANGCGYKWKQFDPHYAHKTQWHEVCSHQDPKGSGLLS